MKTLTASVIKKMAEWVIRHSTTPHPYCLLQDNCVHQEVYYDPADKKWFFLCAKQFLDDGFCDYRKEPGPYVIHVPPRKAK